MSVISISKQYRQRPSEIIGLTNDYEAFCFDEACSYIISKIQDEDAPEPKFMDEEKPKNNNDIIKWLNTNNSKS
ncbi:hypothetical protein ACYIU4_002823 [Clostridium botulinum]